MIRLTRLNGQQFILNSDLIKTIEATPDTVISLTQGDKLMVREDVDSVITAIVRYRQQLSREPSFERESERNEQHQKKG